MWKTFLKGLQEQLKGERGVRLVVILGIVGLALILLSSFMTSDEIGTEEESEHTEDTYCTEELTVYCREMETELKAILEQIDGVGNCEVMLTAASTAENVYLQDEEIETDDSEIQKKQSTVILSDSTGERVLVQQVLSPQISGVIVVCDGASGNVVKERVSDAVRAILDIPANRICVVPTA